MNKKEIMSAIGNLVNYAGPVKPWILEENLQSLHYEDNKTLDYILNIILISTDKVFPTHNKRDFSLKHRTLQRATMDPSEENKRQTVWHLIYK